MSRQRKEAVAYSILLGILLLCVVAGFVPMGLGASLAFIALSVLLIRSALKYRGEGWVIGLLFAVLNLTIPLWTLGAFKLLEHYGLFGR
jgi:hypothetical protein